MEIKRLPEWRFDGVYHVWVVVKLTGSAKPFQVNQKGTGFAFIRPDGSSYACDSRAYRRRGYAKNLTEAKAIIARDEPGIAVESIRLIKKES